MCLNFGDFFITHKQYRSNLKCAPKSAAIASRCLGDKIFCFLCAAATVAKVSSTVFHLGRRRNTSNHYQNRWAVAKLQSAEIDRIVNYHSKYCQSRTV